MGRASPSSRPIPAPLRAPVCQRAATLIAALLQFHRRSCGLTAPLLLALRTPRRSYTAAAVNRLLGKLLRCIKFWVCHPTVEELSNAECSLNAAAERSAVSCESTKPLRAEL